MIPYCPGCPMSCQSAPVAATDLFLNRLLMHHDAPKSRQGLNQNTSICLSAFRWCIGVPF
ncbi:unnamed protein product, partial [Staurois parvus]